MTLQVATANRLSDGLVVYLTAEDGWSERIADSRAAASEAEAAELLALAERAAEECVVVTPYLIGVIDDVGVIRPVRYREVIRALGPTILPGTGQPAAHG